MNTLLPEWMKTTCSYEPPTDKDGFVIKTAVQFAAMLSMIGQSGIPQRQFTSAPAKLLFTFALLVLLACSHNSIFALFVFAGFLVRACLLNAILLKRVICTALGAAALSLLVLLPSVFLGSPQTMLTLSSKVFLSTALVVLLSVSTPWNQLTAGLRLFRVPNLFVFTLDMTLKYIVLLGNVCLSMLQALQLRSIGKNPQKARSLSGIAGTAFLKSQAMAEEQYNAMVCRGFDGHYRPFEASFLRWTDSFLLLLLVCALLLFLRLEAFI